MSTELGHLLDRAVDHIRAAHPLAPQTAPAGVAVSALDVLLQIEAYGRDLGWDPDEDRSDTVMQRATADLRHHLVQAGHHLALVNQLAAPLDADDTTPKDLLGPARQALAAARDLLSTHRGPHRELLTPYALVLAQSASQRYLALRLADTAWELARLLGEVTDPQDQTALQAELAAARRALQQAAVLGRAAAAGAAHETAALPAAVRTHSLPPAPNEPAAAALTGLQSDAEQLLRAAFQSERQRDLARPTGSDWPQIARSLAMTRLLTARLLEHLDPNSTLTTGLEQAARHWHTAAETWHHVVDLSDPTAHPLLPAFDAHLRHQNKASPLPRPAAPHPAHTITHAMTLRTGRLLYGPRWQPGDASSTHPPRRRPARRHRGTRSPPARPVPRVRRYLAAAAPALVARSAQDSLVTDSIEHRPPDLPGTFRFYPAHHDQIADICDHYRTAGTAEDTVCATLAHRAAAAGAPITRVPLDHALLTLYVPTAPHLTLAQEKLTTRQEKILQRIIADSQARKERYVQGARQLALPHEPRQQPSTPAPPRPPRPTA